MPDQIDTDDLRSQLDRSGVALATARARISELERELGRRSRTEGYLKAVASQREVEREVELGIVRAELGIARAELKDLHNTAIPAREVAIANLVATIEELHTVHIADRDREIEQLHTEVKRLRAEIDRLVNSPRWRITRPLKSITKLLFKDR